MGGDRWSATLHIALGTEGLCACVMRIEPRVLPAWRARLDGWTATPL